MIKSCWGTDVLAKEHLSSHGLSQIARRNSRGIEQETQVCTQKYTSSYTSTVNTKPPEFVLPIRKFIQKEIEKKKKNH